MDVMSCTMDDMTTGHIYALHTSDSVYRYIGISTDPAKRFVRHRANARNGDPLPVYCWMRKYGDDVSFTILESYDDYDEALNREIEWIADLRTHGYDLLNTTDGGEGSLGVKRTQAQKDHLSALWTGVPKPPRVNPPWNKGQRGYMSEEGRAAIRAANTGVHRVKSPEECARISAGKKGKPNFGAHRRWHLNRNLVVEGCVYCDELST